MGFCLIFAEGPSRSRHIVGGAMPTGLSADAGGESRDGGVGGRCVTIGSLEADAIERTAWSVHNRRQQRCLSDLAGLVRQRVRFRMPLIFRESAIEGRLVTAKNPRTKCSRYLRCAANLSSTPMAPFRVSRHSRPTLLRSCCMNSVQVNLEGRAPYLAFVTVECSACCACFSNGAVEDRSSEFFRLISQIC